MPPEEVSPPPHRSRWDGKRVSKAALKIVAQAAAALTARLSVEALWRWLHG
ncbi:hypothetical protein GCM10009550_24530 [Actinocorallia libanotica]|uniref:Transposase n=1 Tax=Actinocorallia libanotica TaxID=46162 RepID=A0ABP4BEL3_9ACTN